MALSWPHAGYWGQALFDPLTNLIIPNTQFNVYQSDGATQLQLYTDRTKATTRTQDSTLKTDSAGNAKFFGDPYSGLIISIAGQQLVTTMLPDVQDLSYNFLSDGGAHTAYTLQNSDNMKALGLGASLTTDPLVVTVPATLPLDFSCDVWNEGSGFIQFVAATNCTLNCLNVSSTTTVWHPGKYGPTSVITRFNSDGSHAVVLIGGGIAAHP
jgi:hypothetical protein